MEDFKNFLRDYWIGQPENRGLSYTYASCMLDYGKIPDEIYDEIIDIIKQDSWARREWIEGQTDETILNMIDRADLNDVLSCYMEDDE